MNAQQQMQLSMGYTTPLARPGCRNCAHARHGEEKQDWPLSCQHGKFNTTSFAVCGQH